MNINYINCMNINYINCMNINYINCSMNINYIINEWRIGLRTNRRPWFFTVFNVVSLRDPNSQATFKFYCNFKFDFQYMPEENGLYFLFSFSLFRPPSYIFIVIPHVSRFFAASWFSFAKAIFQTWEFTRDESKIESN